MKRSMMQAYVRGSNRAVALYQAALDAKLLESHPAPDGTLYHSELDVYGQILAVSELAPWMEPLAGNAMQFCLHFAPGEESLVRKAYDVLKEGAQVVFPLGPCDYCGLMADIIDRFGVRWCIFVC